MITLQKDMTDKYIPALKAIAPDSGAYLNEVRYCHNPSTSFGATYSQLCHCRVTFVNRNGRKPSTAPTMPDSNPSKRNTILTTSSTLLRLWGATIGSLRPLVDCAELGILRRVGDESYLDYSEL